MSVFPSKVNFVTGDILTAPDMNEIGQAINLLEGAQYASGKNRVINGAFNVWQRGTSISVPASSTATYWADRFAVNTGANQATTISRQLTNDTTNLPFIQYCARVQRNSGQTGTANLTIAQAMETATSIPLAGRTVTMTFYARAGANYSAASSLITAIIRYGTGTDQNALNAYTGDNTSILNQFTLTSTWQRFSMSGTLPATATEVSPTFYTTPVGTAGANDWFEITGIQLEAGATASPFQTAMGTIQGELAACQRYYYRTGGNNAFQWFGNGFASSTTNTKMLINTPVSMRVPPTSIDFAGNLAVNDGVTQTAVTTPTFSIPSVNQQVLDVPVASGLTQYRPYAFLANNSTAAYIGFNAEL